MHLVDAYQVEILLTLLPSPGRLRTRRHLAPLLPPRSRSRSHSPPTPQPEPPTRFLAHETIDSFWEVIDEIQNAVLFVLLGLEVLAILVHPQSIASGLVAIVAVNTVRIAVVALLLASIRIFQRSHKSSLLAYPVLADQGRSWILATTYVVVVFSIAIQGGSMDLFLRRFTPKLGTHPEHKLGAPS
jgi:CPA1 family monovalent cation:H+ antiporter